MPLLFTDVDGTMLDATGRCPVPASVFARISASHEVVLASSRTLEDLDALAATIGASTACIAEDGAVLRDRDGSVTILGAPRDRLLELGTGLAELEVAGIHREPAGRRASLLVPAAQSTPEARARFRAHGLTLTPGGRWATVTAGSDKGRAARVLARRRDVSAWTAIGDGENDRPLLLGARQAFVIRGPDGHHPALVEIPRAVCLDAPGPIGWIEMAARLEAVLHRTPDEGGDR
jgi:predicted mannosyl-3-phosphoglycerate phosphatase (HAD superfamily)